MKKRKPHRPRVTFGVRTAGIVLGDRRTKRQRTRGQKKVQLKRELAGDDSSSPFYF